MDFPIPLPKMSGTCGDSPASIDQTSSTQSAQAFHLLEPRVNLKIVNKTENQQWPDDSRGKRKAKWSLLSGERREVDG